MEGRKRYLEKLQVADLKECPYRLLEGSWSSTHIAWRGEWPSGPAKPISFTEVKHGCVRSETGLVTFQINDQKTAHSAVLRKGR